MGCPADLGTCAKVFTTFAPFHPDLRLFQLCSDPSENSRPKSILRTAPLLHKRRRLNRGLIGGRRCAAPLAEGPVAGRRPAGPYGRLCTAFDFFTLFCAAASPRTASIRREVIDVALKSNSGLQCGLFPWYPRCFLRRFWQSLQAGIVRAQEPSGDSIVLVNYDRDFVERKKKGEFVARPLFDREIENLFYAVRDADTGDWISAMYRVRGGEKKPERRLGVQLGVSEARRAAPPRPRPLLPAGHAGRRRGRQEGRLLRRRPHPPIGKDLGQDPRRPQPGRWAKAFAGWVIEGVHGTLCGVVERASGEDADNCGGG